VNSKLYAMYLVSERQEESLMSNISRHNADVIRLDAYATILLDY
jgi:hypothetical protein